MFIYSLIILELDKDQLCELQEALLSDVSKRFEESKGFLFYCPGCFHRDILMFKNATGGNLIEMSRLYFSDRAVKKPEVHGRIFFITLRHFWDK